MYAPIITEFFDNEIEKASAGSFLAEVFYLAQLKVVKNAHKQTLRFLK